MHEMARDLAQSLSRQHGDQPRLLFEAPEDGDALPIWRAELRHVGVPLLELNGAPAPEAREWLVEAEAFSVEFMMPVVVFGAEAAYGPESLRSRDAYSGRQIEDPDWLNTRQVAVTRAVETSVLNREFRRSRERKGWIRLGWQPESMLGDGNGLLLAWSSPLPLRRIRDFAARCPEITLIGPDAEAIAAEVAAQGISVMGWRFAVK